VPGAGKGVSGSDVSGAGSGGIGFGLHGVVIAGKSWAGMGVGTMMAEWGVGGNWRGGEEGVKNGWEMG